MCRVVFINVTRESRRCGAFNGVCYVEWGLLC